MPRSPLAFFEVQAILDQKPDHNNKF